MHASTTVTQILNHFGGKVLRVYIVDDDVLARRTLSRLLATANIQSDGFASASAFIAALDTLDYGCVLLDIDMPGESGLDALAAILGRRPPLPVVMASGSTQFEDAVTAFHRGALHFLRKPYHRAELLDALDKATRVGLERLQESARRADAERIHLTTREQQVLEAMANGRQSKQIAWDLGLSVRTVEMHRSNVLTKLSARNASQAVAIARSLDLLSKPKAAA